MDRILVADDELFICQLVGMMLSNSGYEVIEASDGEEGFNMAKEGRPSLMIMEKHGIPLLQEGHSQRVGQPG